jgi:hypothetical protein
MENRRETSGALWKNLFKRGSAGCFLQPGERDQENIRILIEHQDDVITGFHIL